MPYKAMARFIRVSPRKVRASAGLIRGKSADEAVAILANLNKPTALYLKKVLASAIANAKNRSAEAGKLYVSKVLIDEGSALKRIKAGPMGRVMPRLKRSAHICVELERR